MKIALITEKYPPDPGGLAVSTQRLGRLLNQAGHSVQVFAPSSNIDPGTAVSADENGLAVTRFGAYPRTDDTLAAWFDLLVSRHHSVGFDVLHAYYITQAGFVAAFAGQYLGLPSVVSARGNDLDRAVFDPAKAGHSLHALMNASALTANSQDLVRKAHALAPGRPVSYIPNGVDGTLFGLQERNENLSQSLGIEGRPVIGFVGEARAKKGLAALLLAYREIVPSTGAALLLIGGVRSGEDKDLLKVFQKQNPALPVIVIPPLPFERLPDYYPLMDVLALPSLRDGLPNALLEGMASARAVVAAATGGIVDVIRDGENGILVPPGDVSRLANCLYETICSPDLRLRLGQSARATVLRDYSMEKELNGNLAIYHSLGLVGSDPVI